MTELKASKVEETEPVIEDKDNDISDLLTEELSLYYGDITSIVVNQVYKNVYKRLYDGDYYLFRQMCLEPYLKLLQKIKKSTFFISFKWIKFYSVAIQRGSFTSKMLHISVQYCTIFVTLLATITYKEEHGERKYFPFCYKSAVLLHLCDDLQSETQCHDFYFCLRLSESVEPDLVVKYHTINGVQEYLIMEGEYHLAFTTDILKHIETASEGDIVSILRNCIVSVEEGIERLKWDDIADDNGDSSVNSCQQEKCISSDLAKAKLNDSNSNNDISEQNGNIDKSSQSSKCDIKTLERTISSEFYKSRLLDSPQSVMDVDHEVLQSGIAVLPGCRDVKGGAVILIFTGSTFWHNRHVSSTELARLLMYFYSIPRKEVLKKGISIVGDIRGATSSIINILLESLYLFHDNIPNCESILHLVCDKQTQSYVLRSPVYDSRSCVKLDLLSSPDLIHRIIHPSQLPSALDGTFPFSHTEWVRFRMKLEPFLNACREVAKFLISIMQEISSMKKLPRTAEEASQLIEEHDEKVKRAFSDSCLIALQNDGENTMSSLRREESCGNSEDYR
ncbi:hypothetical protein LOTGIDRAFT_155910 [Lottia gigantea]|uniref:CRAL-TRIO domain-containing protein n=1 Tax=Lottia gigantea TaxID=225164 RepID=V3YXT2_LOTGI|nr:hypothetical protein LOTGIDRAFT_155910 [Lottia gigantea]ESO82873.1 hypothetical protein LOTGIDRAFT_155910 [Lottia gigantea]